MREHLAAVDVRLTALGITTHITWAVNAAHPYFVLSSPTFDPSDEANVASDHDTIDALVRVKAVTGTDDGVRTMLDLARDDLSPGLASSELTVAGRSARIRFVRSEFVDVDRDVTITDTDRHPFMGVDTYRIVSQPV